MSKSLWPPWTAVCHASLSFTISRSLLKLISIKSVKPPNHLILHHPRLLLPSVFPSIRVFSNESALQIRWPKYWSFSISPSKEYSGSNTTYMVKCQSSLLHLTKMIYTLTSSTQLLDQERKYLLIILCPHQLIKRGMAHPFWLLDEWINK